MVPRGYLGDGFSVPSCKTDLWPIHSGGVTQLHLRGTGSPYSTTTSVIWQLSRSMGSETWHSTHGQALRR